MLECWQPCWVGCVDAEHLRGLDDQQLAHGDVLADGVLEPDTRRRRLKRHLWLPK